MAQFKRPEKLYSPVNPTPAKNMQHAYRGRLKKQKEKSQQRMSKDDHYSVSATNRKSRKRVIADNVQEVLSEKARHDEEILKAVYSKKKKKTNETPSHSNTTKTSTATSSEEAAQTTTTTSTKTTTTKTSEAAGTTTVKTKQKQSKLTSFFKL